MLSEHSGSSCPAPLVHAPASPPPPSSAAPCRPPPAACSWRGSAGWPSAPRGRAAGPACGCGNRQGATGNSRETCQQRHFFVLPHNEVLYRAWLCITATHLVHHLEAAGAQQRGVQLLGQVGGANGEHLGGRGRAWGYLNVSERTPRGCVQAGTAVTNDYPTRSATPNPPSTCSDLLPTVRS